MRTISSGSAQRWAPTGLSGVVVALSSCFSVNGSPAMAARPPAAEAPEKPAAVSFALELDCELVVKASKVEGVYDKDPAKFPDAVKLDKVSFQEAVEDNSILVMDKAAMGLAMEQGKPIVVFDAMKPDNFLKVVCGEPVGTMIG